MNHPTLTPIEALEAIKARIMGVWDNPELEKIGALATNKTDDILYIIDRCVPELQGMII